MYFIKKSIKVTKIDFLSMTLAIIPVVLFAMALAPYVFGDLTLKRTFGRTGTVDTESSNFFLILGLILLPVSLFFYIRRVKFVIRILEKGEKVEGRIDDIDFTKDRGYVVYTYDVNNKAYKTTNRVMKSAATKSFSLGDVVTIRYDKQNPEKAFLSDMYKL